MKREKFDSRLGFILVSAGCAIGLGNVWKFPYIYGAAFILIYLVFFSNLGNPGNDMRICRRKRQQIFFLFLTFAALSTIIAVFENIIAFNSARG